MSRALHSIRAARAFDVLTSRFLISTSHLSECPFHFYLNMCLISLVPAPARRLHVRAEAVPSVVRYSTDDSRRITTPASADVSGSLARHLDETFAPLEFPPALAQRILTHLSHRDSVIGHNSRFAFLGALKIICPTSSQFPLITRYRYCRTANTRSLPPTLPAKAPNGRRTRSLAHRRPCTEHTYPRRTRRSSLETAGRYALGPAARRGPWT